MTLRVLAVCAGNICRSPAAEAAIRSLAKSRELDLEVDSAGTGSWNVGEPPHPQSVDAGKRVGLTITGRARTVNSADFGRSDVILVMDRSNLRDMLAKAPDNEARAKVRLLRTYDPDTEDDEIPDPYGGTAEDYDRAISQIMQSTAGFIDTIDSA